MINGGNLQIHFPVTAIPLHLARYLLNLFFNFIISTRKGEKKSWRIANEKEFIAREFIASKKKKEWEPVRRQLSDASSDSSKTEFILLHFICCRRWMSIKMQILLYFTRIFSVENEWDYFRLLSVPAGTFSKCTNSISSNQNNRFEISVWTPKTCMYEKKNQTSYADHFSEPSLQILWSWANWVMR